MMETALTTAIRTQAQAQTTSVAEFDDVVRRYQRRVYRVLFVLVRDPEEADGLTQECFLRAYQSLDSFRGDSSLQTWLMRIAVNLARDHARSRRIGFWKRLLGFSDDAVKDSVGAFPCPSPTPEQSLLARSEVQAVWDAARELSPQQQAIFTLRFVEEMELGEIAQILGVQVGTVKAQLFRAVHAVRDKLKEQQWR